MEIPAHSIRSALAAACLAGVAASCKNPPYEDPSRTSRQARGRGAQGAVAAPASSRVAPRAADEPDEAAPPGAASNTAGRADPQYGRAPVGAKAPDFRVRDDEGREVRLADFVGRNPVLLLFYPKDFTSGCTAELSKFGAKHGIFADLGVKVFGVSIDPPKQHHAFRRSLRLPFPLLADEDGALSAAYGALMEQGDRRFSLRKVVLVGRDGKVAYRDESYRVGDPAEFDAVVEAAMRVATPKAGAAEGAAAP